jgi:hypothetical protein
MTPSNVVGFSEHIETMTFEEAMAFVERTRRQLDRFDAALPHKEGQTIDPAEAQAIRQMCDVLEADMKECLESC